jgi:hypothetical protein
MQEERAVPSMGDNNPPELMIPERLVPFDESEPQSSGRALSAELAQDAPDVRRVVTVAKRLWQFTKWMGQTTLSLGARVILEENAIPLWHLLRELVRLVVDWLGAVFPDLPLL